MFKVSYQVDQTIPHDRIEQMFCDERLLNSWPWFQVDHIERVWDNGESTTYVRGHTDIFNWLRVLFGRDIPWAMCTIGWD